MPAWLASGLLFTIAAATYVWPAVPDAVGIAALLLWFAYVACLRGKHAGDVLWITLSVAGFSALVGDVDFLPAWLALVGAVAGCVALYFVYDRRVRTPPLHRL